MRPFLIRVESDDVADAERIAVALRTCLAARDPRPRIATRRGLVPGTRIVVGLWDEQLRPRWLAPQDVPRDPAAAAASTLRFLETWGFVHGAARAPT